jgi:hypothetical protein
MTEAEWLSASDVKAMLAFVRQRTSARKRRLFAAACCRLIWPLLRDSRSRKAVEVAERFADGTATAEELFAAESAADEVDMALALDTAEGLAANAVYATTCNNVGWDIANATAERAEEAAQRAGIRIDRVALVRDVFGNPFRRIAVAPTVLGPIVISLAQAAYEERALPSGFLAPERLGVLSDALEEAGCTDAELLSHLRSPGPHVRGCWALDLLLDRG